MPFKGPFLIKHCFTNGTVNLKYGPTKIMYNMHWIKPYKYDTKVEDISSKNMSDDVNILPQVIQFHIILKPGNKEYNGIITEKLTLNHLGRAVNCF